MFKKQQVQEEEKKTSVESIRNVDMGRVDEQTGKNTILKGSKLIGDISVTCDLELDGDVEGNITSERKSNIIIKGNCIGNITAKEGSVDIRGEMHKGDITAGGNVKVTGKFDGGKIEAKGEIYIDGVFSGRLEGKSVEIGPGASGKGEVFYQETISIARGAKVEASISHAKSGKGERQKGEDAKVVTLERSGADLK